MKRGTKYYYDPQFRAAIDRERARACEEAELGGWITYAIHDPTRRDTFGEFNTLIIYVGQTKQFGIRVTDRLRRAGTAVKRPTKWIDGALYDVMSRGAVPRFRVIERMPDAIDSFVSETNWAKRYIAAGYPIRNKWVEQRFAGLPIDRGSVPHDWLWRLAVEDALEGGIDLVATDKSSGQDTVLDLATWRPKELLRTVKRSLIEQFKISNRSIQLRLAVR
jgi:hypothetical protein